MTSGIVRAAQRALVVAALTGSLAACAAGPRSAADCGRYYTGGGSGVLGSLAASGAFDRPVGPDCRQPPLAKDDSGFSVPSPSPPVFTHRQTVYSAAECIGPIVMGVCHGAILPQSANHPTCHGQMLNGVYNGPMF